MCLKRALQYLCDLKIEEGRKRATYGGFIYLRACLRRASKFIDTADHNSHRAFEKERQVGHTYRCLPTRLELGERLKAMKLPW